MNEPKVFFKTTIGTKAHGRFGFVELTGDVIVRIQETRPGEKELVIVGTSQTGTWMHGLVLNKHDAASFMAAIQMISMEWARQPEPTVKLNIDLAPKGAKTGLEAFPRKPSRKIKV